MITYKKIDNTTICEEISEKIDIDLLSNEIVKQKAIKKQNHETYLNKLKEERQNYINHKLDKYYNIITDTEFIKNILIKINVNNYHGYNLLMDDIRIDKDDVIILCREELIHKPLNTFNNNKYKDENRSIYQIILDKLPTDDYDIIYYYDLSKFKIDIYKKNNFYYFLEFMRIFCCCGYSFYERKGSYHIESMDSYLNPK